MNKNHPIMWPQVGALLREGHTGQSIADKLGVSFKSLQRSCLRTHGVTWRTYANFIREQLPMRFDEAEMRYILTAYYSTPLHKLYTEDAQDSLQAVRAIRWIEDKIPSTGQGIKEQLTWRELHDCFQTLADKSPVIAGVKIPGFWEYCLKVSVGQANPSAEANADKPKPNKSMKAKALTQLLYLIEAKIYTEANHGDENHAD